MPIGAFRLNTVSKLIAEATVIYARTAKIVTANGNAQVSTAQSEFGGSSALFDGTGDYLVAGTTGDYTFGTGDFTLECWFRYSSLAANATLMDLRFNVSSDAAVVYFDSNVLKVYTNGAVRITSGNSFSANTWYHVALSRSGTALKLFVDGVQTGSTYTDSTTYSSSNKLNIGVNYDLNNSTYWNGYIDEFRISNTARYTSNFTPLNIPFVNDNKTLLLIHADGANASTTFTDDNVSHRRPVNPFGNAQVSTAQSKFGGSSLLISSSIDRFEADSIALGSGNWTMECWFRANTLSGDDNLIEMRTGSDTAPTIYVSGGTLYYAIGFSNIITGSSLSTNTWYHVAVSKSGTSTRLFLNGTQVGSTYTDTNTYVNNGPLIFGNYFGKNVSIDGYLDEIRISNSARYTGTFTPATAQFEPDANTLLLIHGDGTTLGTQVYNDVYGPPVVGHQSKNVMPYGNAQISTAQSKFGSSSALLDGTLDYLAIPYNADFAYGTGDWTIEFWIRFNALSTVDNKLVWEQRPAGTNGAYPTIYITTAQKIIYYANTANRCVGTTTLVINTWYHIAVSRSGTNTRLFVNGTQEGSTYSDSTNYLTNTTEMRIGQNFDAGFPDNVNGYLDEIRVSNTARYTTTFTPATTAFQPDANTIMLLHCDGANGSTRFVDDGSNPVVLDDVVIHASTTGTATTITIPAAANIGDYAILFDSSTTTTDTIPSGWTSINGVTTTGIRTNISFKRLVSGDPNTSVTGMGGNTRKIMLIVKGNSDLLSNTRSTPGSQATTATPTNQTISTSSVNTPAVFFAVYASTGAITTRGWTGGTPVEYSSVSTNGIYVKALTYGRGTTPATATISMSDGGTNTLQSFSMKFA